MRAFGEALQEARRNILLEFFAFQAKHHLQDIPNVANSSSNSDFDPTNIASDLEIGCDSGSANFDIADFDLGNTQQFGSRGSPATKIVNERLENKITKLTSLVRQLAIGQHHSSPLVRECGMCASIEHPTNVCPILQEIEPQRYQPPPSFKP
ncbi:hypothetical protein CR513_01403, partial [Mucuna pruriens]